MIQIPSPQSIINTNMGGVDLADQKRSYYSVGRESKKFWKCLLWYIINTAICNSFILLQEYVPFPHTCKIGRLTHLNFRIALISQLIGGFTCCKRAGRKSDGPVVLSECNLGGHLLVKMGKKLVCRNCSQKGNKTPKERGIRTSYQWSACKIPLCRSGCHVDYHARHS